MCLTAVNFASNYDSQSGEFIGVGYKVLKPEGILAPKLNQKKLSYKLELLPSAKRWKKAKFDMYNPRANPDNTVTAADHKLYPPGFHIFLNAKDAKNYGIGALVQVHFKDVIAFGKQTTGYNLLCDKVYNTDCVISRYMKIVDVLSIKG